MLFLPLLLYQLALWWIWTIEFIFISGSYLSIKNTSGHGGTGNWTLKSLAILQTAFEVTVVTKELNAWCIIDYWNLDISLFLTCSATVMIQSICLYHHEVTTMGSLLHWAEPKPNCSSWDMTRRSTIKTRLRVWVCSFCTLRFLRVALVGCPILCWDSEVALQISSVV